MFEQIRSNMAPGPDFEADQPGLRTTLPPLVRLIAFYLPQFHPIPENDAWWGRGFTEWTNVTKALPRFKGHYQPRLPGDLGFYDLRMPVALQAQADLARRYGISGFCFHHYWFAGRTILETPLRILLEHPEIDLPFCVNWANENWSRRWDGYDKDILLEQKHSPEDDLAFAASLEKLFADPRYIRIEGRPLLMLYRPGILPDAAATVSRWRAHFQAVGLGDPYIVMAQAFNDGDPARYGMDAAAGFPPFWAGWDLPRLQGSVERLDPGFRGDIVDYEAMATQTIAGHPEAIKVFPGVCPSWDNDARKPGRGFTFTGSTPAKYGSWLHAACRIALRAPKADERVVFINAWNEWAEGAYLEPDRHFGHAYLAETARVLDALHAATPAAGAAPPARVPPPPPSLISRAQRKLRGKLADWAEKAADRLRGA